MEEVHRPVRPTVFGWVVVLNALTLQKPKAKRPITPALCRTV